MTKRRQKFHFDDLSNAEKERIYRQCERIGVDAGHPLSAADRQRHRRAGLRVGRPRIGKGIKRINVSMEKDLLKLADTVARKRGISRARLIAESIKAYIRSAA